MNEPDDEALIDAVVRASFTHGAEETAGPRKDAKKAKLDCGIAIMALAQRLTALRAELVRCQEENKTLRGWEVSCKEWKALAIKNEDRAEKAEAAFAEAVKVMDLISDICTFDVTMAGPICTGTNASACVRAYKAASAWAQLHGGRDG